MAPTLNYKVILWRYAFNQMVNNVSNEYIERPMICCTGTSVEEGIGICHAICEYLLNLKVSYLIDLTDVREFGSSYFFIV